MNTVKELFKIKYPIIQAGMVWCSGWKLASAVSNAGGLGLIGAGSMHPDNLENHIQKCQKATQNSFGVNVPLLYPEIDQLIEIIIKNGVKIVFTSAGNPATWTEHLKKVGIKVVHVVSNMKFALKAEEAGVDAIVAEGFEAGGHNGREEITTFCLLPAVKKAVKVPLIAAGGINSGRSIFGAMALGADGVQIGSRFAITEESSAHINFKKKVIAAKEGDTILTLRQLAPVRLIKNDFYQSIVKAEKEGASNEDIQALLGKGRAKKGIFEGDLKEGELEIGQVSAYINEIKPAGQLLQELWAEYINVKEAFYEGDS